ncbi:phage tail protein [Psychroserpens sp.]|uniref:phage tail protein n=1 Tax=Psychroserpens sp. TaxID=2020870 RepID=UPI001B017559|nr:tail fiber protein [Psychroserpens sp.]MBO6605639.1 phage tail protein [Psychroserpens sp.]MBO6630685.1 phage tail protein [Psychroserpens sp.]MBO6653552.1 phage tail protein [Psychroserpens sp.]MBO6681873.1 phage tail protein [Psychroserpens sp.]MBO6749013.1 phage tail protein [Psychroserpens sp.]
MNPYLAQIVMFAGNFAPRGWAFCSGQLLPIAQYSALYSLMGTMYGGDGRTTFALPDLRGRLPKGMGSGPGLTPVQEGEKGGHELVTLAVANMPAHSHDGSSLSMTLSCNEEDGDNDEPSGRTFGIASSGTPYNSSANDATFGGGTISGNTGNQGNNQAFDVQNPFLGVNYIIALQGTFPPRN